MSVNVKQEQLGSALKTILAPLDLDFEVSGKQIILKRVKLPVEKLNPQSYKSATLDRTISGTVTDKDGSFLPGVFGGRERYRARYGHRCPGRI